MPKSFFEAIENYEHTDDMNVIYSGVHGDLIVPKTKDAAAEISQGTRWVNFDYYKQKGKLYVWIDKSGEKYQFNFETKRYMDTLDNRISDNKMKYFVNEHPVLSKFFSKIALKYPLFSLMYMNNPPKDVQLAAVKQNGLAIRYIRNPDDDVKIAAIQSNEDAYDYIHNPSTQVQIAFVSSHRYAGYNIQEIKNPSLEVQVAAIKHRGLENRLSRQKISPEAIAISRKNG